MNKLATTIEQSKKLLELGLKPETSDMMYVGITNTLILKNDCYADELDIPAWSLSALIELMPFEIYDKMFSDGKVGSFRTFELAIETNQRDNNRYKIKYRLVSVREFGKYLKICEGRTLLDASYNMVVWLLEHKYINTK